VLLLEDSDVLLVLNVGTSGFKVAIMLFARDAQTVMSLVAVCVLSQILGERKIQNHNFNSCHADVLL
jgi:hypothetical protein